MNVKKVYTDEEVKKIQYDTWWWIMFIVLIIILTALAYASEKNRH